MQEALSLSSEPSFAFGPFKLLPHRKTLFKSDHPQILGSRALEILTLLVDRGGRLVSKAELVAHAWPHTHVEEINLRVHVAALRKALGDGQGGARYIMNHPGRGYCFVAPVTRIEEQQRLHARRTAIAPTNLPALLTSMIGRDDVTSTLEMQLKSTRFLTLAGPGGVGKTTVALAVAGACISAYEHGIHFIDLAPLTDSAQVPAALASAIGLSMAAGDKLPQLIAALRGKSMLLLFDNCEHVAGTVATLTEAMLRTSNHIHILATSREALRAEGEWVHCLAPMALPEDDLAITAANALTSPAVQLFVERAMASGGRFELTDDNAASVADLCRQLDGLPLAIELAASRVKLFGLPQGLAGLDERLLLSGEGRRTATPRQRTLHASLSWSYNLLTEDERLILQMISLHTGKFNLEKLLACCSTLTLDDAQIITCIEHLVEKSLVTPVPGRLQIEFRLLETTRVFALSKLQGSPDLMLSGR